MERAKGDGEERMSGGPRRRCPCPAPGAWALRAWLASVRRRVRRVKFLFAWIWGLGGGENLFEVYNFEKSKRKLF